MIHYSAAAAARLEQIQWHQRHGAPGRPLPSVPSGLDVFEDFCRHLDFEVAAEVRCYHARQDRLWHVFHG